MKQVRKYSFALISSVFLTIVPIVFTSIITLWVIAHEREIGGYEEKFWVIITLACCITSTIAITPPTFLALVFGYFLGWHAILPLFLLNMVAIFLVNMVTRWLDKDRFRTYLSENQRVREILENIKEQELKIIFFAKLSPVLPFALTNFVFALSGAKLKNILLGGFLGMIPRTVLAVWTGHQAKEIRKLLENPNEGNLQQILLILLLVASVAGFFYFLQPRKRK
ncbi:TVP38/TMEM64 family protein [Emticicia sp. BO119]|uniref:TVP38/TMEM64 family protein n=1 Tax=Emticicia sp. BO119 TaxID=2757768 RepID=UPI0015EFE58E|nr:VTT domain-containing protein [Emticicia sp. BO119]MBA4851563.1 VTT domain-containing protein [Emticicia sp. BO119]